MHLPLHLLRFSFASALNITVCDGCVRDTVIKTARVQKKRMCVKRIVCKNDSAQIALFVKCFTRKGKFSVTACVCKSVCVSNSVCV